MSEPTILRVLHLEDNANDAELIQRALTQPTFEVRVVASRSEYLKALATGAFDIVLSDNGVPGFRGISALQTARERFPAIPFIFVSGSCDDERNVASLKAAGATECMTKSDLAKVGSAVRRALHGSSDSGASNQETRYLHGMERLVLAVQELSLARDLETVMAIVRRAARELTGADGATFVLREGSLCHYVDENAIAPLWKGKRFPMSACISGWAMLNRQPAVIEDIYSDPRIPHEAYRPTFVKSLAMVPIRTLDPIGAIGNYWATRHLPTPEEVKLLGALADTAAVALDNVQVYAELEQRVKDRTAELQAANKELEAFSFAVSHDLRAPLRHITGFAQILVDECRNALSRKAHDHLARIVDAGRRMSELIEDLLALSRTTQAPVKREKLNLSLIARDIMSQLKLADPGRRTELIIPEELSADGDPGLLRVVLENLLSNAWKFTAKSSRAIVEVGSMAGDDGRTVYYVRDNGAGFDMEHAGKLFGVFQRLHSDADFAGTGVGLATVQRIIHKHGGRIWAEAAVNQGATFYFTLA
ncbi:MAG TPA: ATP-binding protein [Candidatus Binatia bacterium]